MKKKNKKGKDKKHKRKLARKGGYGTLAGIERSTEKPFWVEPASESVKALFNLPPDAEVVEVKIGGDN